MADGLGGVVGPGVPVEDALAEGDGHVTWVVLDGGEEGLGVLGLELVLRRQLFGGQLPCGERGEVGCQVVEQGHRQYGQLAQVDDGLEHPDEDVPDEGQAGLEPVAVCGRSEQAPRTSSAAVCPKSSSPVLASV